MTVCDFTRPAKGLGNMFILLGRTSPETGKKLATKALKNHGRALENGAKIGSAAASKNSEAAVCSIRDSICIF